MQKICIWADYDWCYYDELEEYGRNKSDDIVTIELEFDDGPTIEQLKEVIDGS